MSDMRRPGKMYLIMSASHFHPQTLSSSEAALLLNSTKNRDLWESPVFGAFAEIRFVFIASQIVRLDYEHASFLVAF